MLREIITPYVIWGVILFVGSVAAGLPNITGVTGKVVAGVGYNSGRSGAFYSVNGLETNVGTFGSGNGNRVGYNFNAYYSNSIYGSSTTVTPLSISTKFFIKY